MRARQFPKNICAEQTSRVADEVIRRMVREILGSTGRQPVRLGSLPRRFSNNKIPFANMLPASCRQLQTGSLRSPDLRRADKGVHFFGEFFERHRIGCGRVA